MMEAAFWLVPFMHRNRNNRAFYKNKGKERDMGKELELDVDIVTLLTDEGEVDCGIITVLKLDEKEYIAVSPLDEEGELSEEVWFYQFERDASGGDEHDIAFIEDEDEYEQVVDKFDEWLDTLEFEE